MSFVNLENARTSEQKAVMKKIEEDGACPFCRENLATYHKKPIHAEGIYWTLTENQWPYEGAKHHLLAIAKSHIKRLEELPSEASSELFELFKDSGKRFGIVGGTIAMRFGPSTKYASTVEHLHAHFIEPDVEDPDHQGMKFPISKAANQQK